jgi:hypothetical protein
MPGGVKPAAGGAVTPFFSTLIRLYPADVRYAYGVEMVEDFEQRLRHAGGRPGRCWCIARAVLSLLCDVAAERVNGLYSHRTFHGRCRPDPGRVRPPNMSKAEWFDSESYAAALHDRRR